MAVPQHGRVHRTPAYEVEIAVAQLDPAPAALSALAACLSAEERRRAGRYVAERDRRRFVVARGRLRQLLAKRVHASAKAVDIVTGLNGKPALGPRFAATRLRFSVAHCEDLAIYAFASGREVGVDLEKVREVPEADAIAERICSFREMQAYAALAPSERLAGFFALWTRKEALAKALGEGLSADLRELDVSPLGNFFPAPGFVAAVACVG